MVVVAPNRLQAAFILTLILILTLVGANIDIVDPEALDSFTDVHADPLASKVLLLGSRMDETAHETESQIEGIKLQEKIGLEKSTSLEPSRSKFQALQAIIVTRWNEHIRPAMDLAVEKALVVKVYAVKWTEPHIDSLKASFIGAKWNEHGKPAIDMMTEKALEGIDQVEKWSEPHMDALRTKWIPTAREHWFAFMDIVEPNLQMLTAKAVEVYHASKDKIMPHIANMQKVMAPYYQEASKLTTMAKPHFGKARTFFKSYTEKEIRCCWKLIDFANSYHRQVCTIIQEKLRSCGFRTSIAIDNIVWYMASTYMALPVIFFYRLTYVIWDKPKLRPLASHMSHTRRWVKRVR